MGLLTSQNHARSCGLTCACLFVYRAMFPITLPVLVIYRDMQCIAPMPHIGE
jgi:hypothetical protein